MSAQRRGPRRAAGSGRIRLGVAAVVAASLLSIGVVPGTADARPRKVDVCHARSNGSYRLIRVPERAAAKHLAKHRDGMPGGAVPLADGFEFDDDCVPVRVPGPDLFVSNARNRDASVLRFDGGGVGTTILGLGDGLGSPRGLAVDPVSGDLFVADAFAQKVFRWSAAGGLSVFADAADGIGNPEGLAFGAAGELFVSNARNRDASVLRFDGGGVGTTILGLGDGLGSPRGLAVDPVSGDLFVADAFAQKVFRWSAAGGLSVFADAADGIGNPDDVYAARP